MLFSVVFSFLIVLFGGCKDLSSASSENDHAHAQDSQSMNIVVDQVPDVELQQQPEVHEGLESHNATSPNTDLIIEDSKEIDKIASRGSVIENANISERDNNKNAHQQMEEAEELDQTSMNQKSNVAEAVNSRDSSSINEKSDTVINETENAASGKADDLDKLLETDKPTEPTKKTSVSQRNLHEAWQDLLSKYVTSTGVVNYTGLLNDVETLDNYLKSLEASSVTRGDKSKKAKAFWINAYNAYTIKLILKNHPINSIRDLNNGNPWDTKWIGLAGETLSLNDIEHKILRPGWGDARIHFAVNCAAKSCPPLANQAYTATNIDSLLEKVTKKFINNQKYNTMSQSRLSLSKIFDWYKEDFGDLVAFISQYTTTNIGPTPEISYMVYDWSLNGK